MRSTPGPALKSGCDASEGHGGTGTAKLVAVDARAGQPCPAFGEAGFVDLTVGMEDHEGKIIGGYYKVTSAPTYVRGKVVVGGWVTDGQYWGETSGVIAPLTR